MKLIGKDEMIFIMNPHDYMRVHIAGAVLSRQEFNSVYKAPDSIWKTLQHLANGYIKEIKNANLSKGKRYVVVPAYDYDPSSPPSSAQSFQSIIIANQNVKIYVINEKKLDQEQSQKLFDFSMFDVENIYLIIYIHDRDKSRVNSQFSRIGDIQDPVERDRKLKKVKFRVIIKMTSQDNIGIAKDALDILQEVVKTGNRNIYFQL